MMKRCIGMMGLMLAVPLLTGCEDTSDKSSANAPAPAEAANPQPSTPQPSLEDPAHRIRDYTYRVVVQNTRNQPVAGALVLMETPGYGSISQRLTNADGVAVFTFGVPGNTGFIIVAESTGYRSAAISGRTGANSESLYYLTLADL